MNSNTDMSEIVMNTINNIFQNLFTSIDLKLYEVLDELTFISSNILKDKYFSNIFGVSTTSGILLISNSLLMGYILYFSIKFFMSSFNNNAVETPLQFIFKLIVCAICMNSSYFIVEQVLSLNFNFSLSIRKLGEEIFGKNVCFSNLISNINSSITLENNSYNVFTLDGIITGTLTFSLLNLLFSYAIRYVMVKIFVLLSPFAILSLCLNSTSWFFKTWIKNLFSLLFIQNIISIILLIIFSIDYSTGEILTKYIYIGSIYCLIRANSMVRELLGGVSTDIQTNIQGLKHLIK